MTAASTDADIGEPPVGSTGGELVYAIGDIHGCYEPLKRLLGRIAADAAGRDPILIFCGDYVDRGARSAEVLDALCWLRRHAPHEVRFLRGNHDQVMLDFVEAPAAASAWLRFGGATTLTSYGVRAPDPDAPPAELVAARDDLLDRLPVAHLRFLHNLEMMLSVGDYVFVHAGLRPGRALSQQVADDLLWIREGFIDVEHRHEKIVVHGHTWTGADVQMLPHRIGIDTGVYNTGVLSAVRLDGESTTILTAS